MGTGDPVTPSKSTKPSSVQDQHPAPPPPPSPSSYADWAAAFQAYFHGAAPPPGYFPPIVAPGQPHTYMWAGQPVIAPYGPSAFAAMYPPGLHGHPSMPQGPPPYPFGITLLGGATDAIMATSIVDHGENKSSDSKECSPVQASKENVSSPRQYVRKGKDNTKSSTNNILSQSAESGSDGSINGSEEDTMNQVDNRSCNQSGGSTGNANVQVMSSSAALSSVLSSSSMTARLDGLPPTTSLNVGLEYWKAAPPAAALARKGKKTSAVAQPSAPIFRPNSVMTAPGRDTPTSDFWLQDERELKRQRRKQSNRESARRSRLRKQAECEELATRVDTLTVENMALRSEISRLVEERDKLSAENNTLFEQLRHDRGEGSCGTRVSEGKNCQRTYSTHDNGKIRSAFDTESIRTQGIRRTQEELGTSVEHVSSGLEIGGHATAVKAS